MTHNKRSSMPIKLIGLTAVVAGVVLSTRGERCKDVAVVKLPNDPVAIYPVDRNELSQFLLPLDDRDAQIQIPTTKRLASVTIAANSDAYSDANANSMRTAATGSTAYELKLSDQRAWGSLQRQVNLVTKEKRAPAQTVNFEIASSNLPLVPGIEDPHLWYDEASTADLASSTAEENNSDSIIPIELTEGTFDFSSPIEIALLPPVLKPKSVLSEPSLFTPVQRNAAPITRTARAWETGRY